MTAGKFALAGSLRIFIVPLNLALDASIQIILRIVAISLVSCAGLLSMIVSRGQTAYFPFIFGRGK